MIGVSTGWANTESVYAALLMIVACSALMLARWTTKRMIIFVFIIATCFALAKAAYTLTSYLPRTYNVTVPYTDPGSNGNDAFIDVDL